MTANRALPIFILLFVIDSTNHIVKSSGLRDCLQGGLQTAEEKWSRTIFFNDIRLLNEMMPGDAALWIPFLWKCRAAKEEADLQSSADVWRVIALSVPDCATGGIARKQKPFVLFRRLFA